MPDRRTPSIRTRATIGAVAVFLLALVVGSVVFVGVLRTTLIDGVASSAEQSLDALANRVESGGATEVAETDDQLVQLQSPGGEVLASGEETGSAALPTADRAEVSRDGERWVLVSDDIDLPDGTEATLVAGASREDADEATSTVGWLLIAGVPLVTAMMGLVTWVVIGRALRPVDRLRSEVDDIESARLSSRVQVPGSRDEIDRLAITMNRMLGRLERSQTVQRRFVSDASHELRSPLATIRQHAELARAHPEAIELSELSELVLEEGERLQELVESLLLLTRLDEIGAERWDSVDVDDLVLGHAVRLRARGGIAVDTTRVGPGRVRGDRSLLDRAIRNLTDNAARHAATTISLSLAATGGRITLIVDDDGSGIAPDDRGRVFDRFVRLDEGRARDAGGSGLGLAIVAGAIAAHSGSITVEEAPGNGARFVVSLPETT